MFWHLHLQGRAELAGQKYCWRMFLADTSLAPHSSSLADPSSLADNSLADTSLALPQLGDPAQCNEELPGGVFSLATGVHYRQTWGTGTGSVRGGQGQVQS